MPGFPFPLSRCPRYYILAKPAAATTAPARSGYNRGGRGGGRGGYGGRGGDYQTFNEPRDNGRAFIAERQVRGEDGEIRSSFDQHQQGDLRRGGGRGGGRGRGYGRDGGQRRPHREFDRMSGTGRGGYVRWWQQGALRHPLLSPPLHPVFLPSPLPPPPFPSPPPPPPPPPCPCACAQQMTLEEYEKVLEEKRKALAASKAAARVVEVDEEMAKMTLKKKPEGDDVFVKLLGTAHGLLCRGFSAVLWSSSVFSPCPNSSSFLQDKEKAARKKDEDRPKTVNINEFLKPAEGQTFHYRNTRGGRGGGRGGGGRYGGGGRGYGGRAADAPLLDQSQFPTLA
ncbi:unnamed protein product [Closterium sp. NIES-54]